MCCFDHSTRANLAGSAFPLPSGGICVLHVAAMSRRTHDPKAPYLALFAVLLPR